MKKSNVIRIVSSILILLVCTGHMCMSVAETTSQKNIASRIQEAADSMNAVRSNQDDNYQKSETFLINMFVRLGLGIRCVSFKEVEEYLVDSGLDYEHTVPTNKEYGKHRIFGDDGFQLYMAYMPIDSSFDSKDFGNTEKEMLYYVELSRDDRSISINDNMHTTETEFSTYNKYRSTPRKSELSIKELLHFFENEMGGILPVELLSVSFGVSDSAKISQSIKTRSKEYFGCSITDIDLNIKYGSDPRKYIVLVHLKFEMNNKLDNIRELTITYSDDLAAYLAKECDNVSDIYVFWRVPKYYDDEIAAKNSYVLSGGHAFITDRLGLLYK